MEWARFLLLMGPSCGILFCCSKNGSLKATHILVLYFLLVIVVLLSFMKDSKRNQLKIAFSH